MALSLHTIHAAPGARKKKIRIGRGGKRGTYSGKGFKGQKSRSGGRKGLKRLGMRQLIEQTHKLRGFKSLQDKPVILNLKNLAALVKDNDQVNPQFLVDQGLVKNIRKPIKILGNGEIGVKIELAGCLVSLSAKEKIEKAGGVVKV